MAEPARDVTPRQEPRMGPVAASRWCPCRPWSLELGPCAAAVSVGLEPGVQSPGVGQASFLGQE